MPTRIFALALILLLGGFAAAWNDWTTVSTFDAPFEFLVSGTALPAGHYAVRTSGTGYTMMVQNVDTGQSAFAQNHNVMLAPNTSHETTKVVFAMDQDGRHVLHQVSVAADDHTHDLIHGQNVPELVRTELRSTQ
ncbi:MAG TPA: hypothetical protein VFU27_01280 [Terriglobales bacterium]|nr:hypothetical protein [Terriglobales bacterium]